MQAFYDNGKGEMGVQKRRVNVCCLLKEIFYSSFFGVEGYVFSLDVVNMFVDLDLNPRVWWFQLKSIVGSKCGWRISLVFTVASFFRVFNFYQ